MWNFAISLERNASHSKSPGWIRCFRYSLRGVYGRLVSVKRNFHGLNTDGTVDTRTKRSPKVKNDWNVIWDSYAGDLFFGMDSSIECFTHGLNSLGFVLNPQGFFDITIPKDLRQITTARFFGTQEPNNKNKICRQLFPKTCDQWTVHEKLVEEILDFHDASKHRHSIAIAHDSVSHYLKPDPKDPMFTMTFDEIGMAHNYHRTVQVIVLEFHDFITALLNGFKDDIELAFNQPLPPAALDEASPLAD